LSDPLTVVTLPDNARPVPATGSDLEQQANADARCVEPLSIPEQTGRSRKQTVDHLTVDIRQTKITTCMTECETLMIESQQV